LNTFAENKMIYIKLVLMSLFWGSNFISGKVMSANLLPFTSSFLRYLAASLFLSIFVIKKYGKLPRINFSQFLLIICLGLTGIAGFSFFFFVALKYVTACRAAIIISLNPSLITILSIFILREKFTMLKFTGIILSLIGAFIVISKGHFLDFFSNKIGYGELYLLGCVIFWATFSVLGKIAMKKLKPIIVTTYAFLAGTLILLIPASLEGQLNHFLQFDLTVWLSIFAMSFFGTALATTWFYEGVDIIGPSRAGIFINFMPVFATLLAIIIFHERLYLSLVIGAAFVLSGVYLTNYQNKASKRVIGLKS